MGSAVPGTDPPGDRRAARTLSEPRKRAFGKMPLDPEKKFHGDLLVRGGWQLPAALALMLQAAAVTPTLNQSRTLALQVGFPDTGSRSQLLAARTLTCQ